MLDSSPIISFRFAYLIAIIAIIFFAISKYGIPALLLVFSLYFLIKFEHPKSTSRMMAEDAKLIHIPKTGGEGKSELLVGGGISAL